MARVGIVLALVVLTGPITVESAEQGCTYSLNPLSTTVSGAGGTGQITVTTGASCSWTASTGTPWLSVSPTAGTGSGTVSWVAAANTLRSQRFGSLTIAGRAVFVSQFQPAAVTTPPGAPRQLTASVNGTSIALTWSPPDGGAAPSTYVVSAGSASGWSNLGSFATGNTLTGFSANNVPLGVYFVRVSAQNTIGTGPASNEVSFTVPEQTCISAPPSALQSTVSGTLVTLTWAAPSGGVSPSSYALEVGSAGSLSDVGTFYTGSAATTFTANAPAGSYFVRVRAVTPCGLTAATADVAIVVP